MAGLVFSLLLAATVRFGLLWGIDLRGAFGPDAPAAAWSAWIDPLAYPYPLHPLLVALLALPAQDPVAGALVLSLVAGLVTVGAAWALARAAAGEAVAFAAGSVAAVCPLLVEGSLLRGGDALAVALAWSGLALAWSGAGRVAAARLGSAYVGAVRVGLLLEGVGVRVAGGPLRILAGCLLVGASAAARPVALPSMVFLLAVPALGGRRTVPWLGLGFLLGGTLAALVLGPHALAAGVSGDPVTWGRVGLRTLARIVTQASWAEIPLLAAIALVGTLVPGPRRSLRLLLLLLGCLALIVPAGLLGDRLMPRHLAASLAGWLPLAGITLVPARRRIQGAPPAGIGPGLLIEGLPLSLGLTILVAGALTCWDGVANVRADQEGTAPPRDLIAGWARDARQEELWRDASVCGALELERIADDLATRLPPGAALLAVPLRDDRIWHLRGPIAARRPDLRFALLDDACCPDGAEACASRVLAALAEGGGAVVGPLAGSARCTTGAVAPGREAWAVAVDALLTERRTWYGWTEVAPSVGASGGLPCLED
jgi:hypothetical protein